jgi:hypothetical protein
MRSLKDDHQMPFNSKTSRPGAKGASMGGPQRSAISRETVETRPEFENLSNKCDKKTVGDMTSSNARRAKPIEHCGSGEPNSARHVS